MLPRVEYSVVVPVSIEVAFRAFQNLGRLLHRGIYDSITWIEGEPWKVGSRVQYVVSKPVSANIAGVVTASEPPRLVTILNHALGITVEQQVVFAPAPGNSSLVRQAMEFVGRSPGLTDEDVRQHITFVAHDALDTMAELCAQWKSTPASG